jgi:starch phosphorylase
VVKHILGEALLDGLQAIGCLENDSLNMTLLGMFFSRFINGVSKRHGEVAQAMFPQFRVEAITNGVHVRTWAAPSTVRLFDEHLPRWREDNAVLRDAESIPLGEVAAAHAAAKRALLDEVGRRSGIDLDPSALTVGFARRAATYKRTDLLVSDPDELASLVAKVGPLQVVYSGKAHPNDRAGKDLIARVGAAAKALRGTAEVVYLPEYGMALAALLVAGVDVWLNNPLAPLEASGTSGMKAAVNGVPSLSIVDGWWVEGWVEGVTGWAIGPDGGATGEGALTGAAGDARDAAELRRVLSEVVAPLYYARPEDFAAVGRSAIALNGSQFTTERMVTEYATRAYGHTARSNP